MPLVHEVTTLADWLKNNIAAADSSTRLLLSLQDGSQPLAQAGPIEDVKNADAVAF